MSGRAYKVYTRSNLDRDRFPGYPQGRRAQQTLLLRLSLGVNLLGLLLYIWSVTRRVPASANRSNCPGRVRASDHTCLLTANDSCYVSLSQWNELLVQSASNISLLNRDLLVGA